MKQWAMIKQYVLAIFMLSAICPMNAMDDGKKASSDPRIKVGQSGDGKAIVAEHVIARWDGKTVYHTTVTKHLAIGFFEVNADFASSFARDHLFISANSHREIVDTLKFKIAEFEKQMQ